MSRLVRLREHPEGFGWRKRAARIADRDMDIRCLVQSFFAST